MKKAPFKGRFVFLVLMGAGWLLLISSGFAAQNTTPDSLKSGEAVSTDLNPPSSPPEILNQRGLSEFFVKDILPAFGKLEDMLLTKKPSFSVRITPRGLEIKECSFQFQLKQLKTIEYLTSEGSAYGVQVDAQIGGPITFLFEVTCGSQHFGSPVTFFEISMSLLNQDMQPTYYGLKVNSLKMEQVDIKLWGLKAKIHINKEKRTLLLGPKGHTRPFTSEFENTCQVEENGLYEVPAPLWPPFPKTSKNITVSVRKISVSHTMNIAGSSELSFPVSLEGVKQDTRFRFPFEGQIFFSEEGEVIPIIDFAME